MFVSRRYFMATLAAGFARIARPAAAANPPGVGFEMPWYFSIGGRWPNEIELAGDFAISTCGFYYDPALSVEELRALIEATEYRLSVLAPGTKDIRVPAGAISVELRTPAAGAAVDLDPGRNYAAMLAGPLEWAPCFNVGFQRPDQALLRARPMVAPRGARIRVELAPPTERVEFVLAGLVSYIPNSFPDQEPTA